MSAAATLEAVYRDLLKRADPASLTAPFVQDLIPQSGPVWVAGVGKAVAAMARPVASALGSRLAGGLLVVPRGLPPTAIPSLDVLEADHPLPTQASLHAGAALMAFARTRAADRGRVIFLLSGGASALAEDLVEGWSLEQLAELNRGLLAAGLPIEAVNAVRSRVSRFKAGGLGAAFGQADVRVLVLSDVAGNDLSVIGSGPLWSAPVTSAPVTSAPVTTGTVTTAAENILADAGIRANLPPLHPLPSLPRPHTVVAGPGDLPRLLAESLAAVGLPAPTDVQTLAGEARVFGEAFAARLSALGGDRPAVLAATGECTVTLRGAGRGQGGRCQEIAAAAAPFLTGRPNLALLAGSTDGADGPTDVAAAIVDGSTVERAGPPDPWLSANDTLPYLDRAGALLRTGRTGSNLTDVVVGLYLPQSRAGSPNSPVR